VPFCTHCRSPNRIGARYCDACGGLLPGGMCSGCGSPNRNGARFCDACGSLLSRDLEPRRLLATLLFTDIVDSTARSAALGDRGWTELLERHHALTSTVRDLCAGSSVVFGDRGPHALKGIEEPWRLFTVM
jgi:class 3 adenylate cyclase